MNVPSPPLAPANWIRVLLHLTCWLVASLSVSGRPPMVPAGASKTEVIEILGWPNGQSKAGTKEILSYAQGQVVLEEGRVTRVDFSPKIPWQAPKAAPASASPTSSRSLQAVQAWGSNFEQVKGEAARLMRPILVVFTGPSQPAGAPRFFEDVASHPEFVDAFRNDFVLMRVGFATQPRLREDCEVAQYPTVVFLNPAGEILGRSEAFPAPTSATRGRIIASVRDAWLAVGGSLGAGMSSSSATGGGAGLPSVPFGMKSWIAYAWTLIISGVGAGIAIMLVLFWLLWRKWNVPQPQLPEITRRISDAASGLPTLQEVQGWSQKKVCAVAAGLAKAEGYHVDTYKLGDNADLELRRSGDTRPHALLLAVGASEGLVPSYRLRDLAAEMASFQVKEGWVVAPAGFGHDATEFGKTHQLILLSGEVILERLRDVPPLSLPGILAQTTAGQSRKR